MPEVKVVIEHLCKFLVLLGFKKISAEEFRRAKFNDATAMKPLLILLAEFMIISNLNWKIPHDLIKQLSKLEEDTLLIEYIKREMLLKGYLLPAYINLENNEDSREILLGIAWVIAKFSPLEYMVLEKINDSVVNLEDFLKPNQLPTPQSLTRTDIFSNSGEHEQISNNRLLQQLLWLMGKVRIFSNKLQQLQLDRLHLMSKIHSCTEDSYLLTDCSHLNIIHVQLLKSPSLLNKYVQTLKKEINLMSIYIKWKEKEIIFWKWMITIWESQLQDKINTMIVDCNFALLEIIKQWYLFLEKKKLNITEYSKNSRRLLCQFPLDNSLESFLPTDIRFVKLNKKLRNQPETIMKVIKIVDLKIVMLEEELKHKRRRAGKCFSELSKKFEDIICIPPIKHQCM